MRARYSRTIVGMYRIIATDSTSNFNVITGTSLRTALYGVRMGRVHQR
jgi:hypothetical protein